MGLNPQLGLWFFLAAIIFTGVCLSCRGQSSDNDTEEQKRQKASYRDWGCLIPVAGIITILLRLAKII